MRTKIFEGDIIEYAESAEYRWYKESWENPEWDIKKGYVAYEDKIAYPGFDLTNSEFECNALSMLAFDDYHYEVIGNIHDNPELLEAKK